MPFGIVFRMIEQLEQIDRKLFLLINGANTEILDQFMWFMSQKYVWIPFYLVLLIIFIVHYGWRQSLVYIVPSVVVLIALSDQISVQLFKNVFERYRPCHNLELQSVVHLVDDHCGGKFGFVSSHAANSFALAVFIVRMVNWRSLAAFILIWAVVVSYSRIYLGVHYPADILGGAVLGSVIALVISQILRSLLKVRIK